MGGALFDVKWTYERADKLAKLGARQREETLRFPYIFATPSEAIEAARRTEKGQFAPVPIRLIHQADVKHPGRPSKTNPRAVAQWPLDTFLVEYWPRGT